MAGTDSVSIGMFYQFLSQKNIQSAEDMVREMDGLGGCEKEGVVIKAEFQSFMQDNWDTALLGEYDKKQVNIFWNSIDTQRSAKKVGESNMKDLNALNENELEAVDKQLAVYEILNSFMSTVSLPNEVAGFGLDNREFKSSINKSLMETCQAVINSNKNKSVDEVKRLIQDALVQAYPVAERKTVANLLAQKTIADLSNKPELSNLDNKAFEDLQGIVSAYISQRAASGEVDLAEIVNEIRYIINQYFTNAGVNTGMNVNVQNPSALTQYTQMDGLSDLQQARVGAKIKEALQNVNTNGCPQEYADYYITLFIENKLSSGQNFTSLMNAANLADEFLSFQVNSVAVSVLLELHGIAANICNNEAFFSSLMGGSSRGRSTSTSSPSRSTSSAGSSGRNASTPTRTTASPSRSTSSVGSSGRNASTTTRTTSSTRSGGGAYTSAQINEIKANLPQTDIMQLAHAKIMRGEIKTTEQLYKYYQDAIRANLGTLTSSTTSGRQTNASPSRSASASSRTNDSAVETSVDNLKNEIKGVSISSKLMNGAKYDDWSDARSAIKTSIKGEVDKIVNHVKGKAICAEFISKVESAATSIKNMYNSALDKIGDGHESSNWCALYGDGNETIGVKSDGDAWEVNSLSSVRDGKSHGGSTTGATGESTTGLYIGSDNTGSKEEYWVFLDTAKFKQRFCDLLN